MAANATFLPDDFAAGQVPFSSHSRSPYIAHLPAAPSPRSVWTQALLPCSPSTVIAAGLPVPDSAKIPSPLKSCGQPCPRRC